MTDLFLRTETKSAMATALCDAGIGFMVDGEFHAISGMAVDMIGPIGGDQRWHANLRLPNAPIVSLPIVDPAPVTPYRKFFD